MTENTETSGEETTLNEAEANWKDALPEDVKQDPSMQAIQTLYNPSMTIATTNYTTTTFGC